MAKTRRPADLSAQTVLSLYLCSFILDCFTSVKFALCLIVAAVVFIQLAGDKHVES